MFKNIISPVQAWLLSQGKCVGCGMTLTGGAVSKYEAGFRKVTCKCRRIYIQEEKTGKYRRARLEET
ncbi:MAG: hypothetical protein AAB506_01860 [Patescibacteria group bacterium]